MGFRDDELRVRVNKLELLGKLEENRTRHAEIAQKANVGFREQAILGFERMLADAKAGKRIRLSLAISPPEDYTKDYDRAIGMLRMSTDETVELTSRQYDQFVRDDWEWKSSFETTNASYLPAVTGEGNITLPPVVSKVE